VQGETTTKNFSDDYIEQCFQIWYSMGTPPSIQRLWEALPENAEGRKPGVALLRTIRDTYGWVERSDALNARAIAKVEEQLVNQKSEMLKRQAQSAFEIGEMAKEHLLRDGFDTSASAVNALKWAQEEERTVRGVSEMMIKISKMSPEELMQEAAKLLKRNSEVIEGETLEEENANNSISPA